MPTVIYPEGFSVTWPKEWCEGVKVNPIKVIYVAGPFRARTQWGIMQNVYKAEDASLRLWKMGYAVICPHTMTRYFQGECPDHVWLDGCIELLKRADAIFMVAGWSTSEGSREELRLARELGLTVMGDNLSDMEVTCPECGCFYTKVNENQNKCPRCGGKYV